MPKTIYKVMSYLLEISKDTSPKEIESILNSLLKGKELRSLTKPIRDYRRAEKDQIQKKNVNLFYQFSLLIAVYTDVIDIIGENWHRSPASNKEETKYKIYAVSCLFYKSIQTMFDMLALLENGALVPTWVLWRIIYESYITSKYLLKKSDDISKRFNDHWQITENRIMKGKNEKIAQKVASLINEYGPAYENNYGWAADKESKKGKYSTFAEIHNEEKNEDFTYFYSLASYIIHSSSFSVNRPIFTDGKHKNTEMVGMFSGGIQLPIKRTIHVMQNFVMILLEYFHFEDPDEKKVLVKIIEVLALSILSELKKEG